MVPMRIEELTVFRFVAAAIVVIFHYARNATDWWPILTAGPQMVTFFFVLSGFVLSVSNHNRDVKFKAFWIARAARILPIYFLALLIFLLLERNHINSQALLLNVLLLQAWVSPFPLSLNFPGWSLSVELFFYLLFPILIWILKKHQVSVLLIVLFASAFYLLTQGVLAWSLSVGFYTGYPSLSHDLIYYFPLTHLCSFLLGVSGGIWFKQSGYVIENNLVSVILVVGSGAVIVYLLGHQGLINNTLGFKLPYGSSLYAPFFLILILAVSVCRSQIVRVLSLRPLVLLGEASYAMYILQVPIHMLFAAYVQKWVGLTGLGNFALYFFMLLMVSIFVFMFFEKPVNRLIRNFALRNS